MVILLNFYRWFRQRISGTDFARIGVLTLTLMIIGVLSYRRLEGWGWLDSIYVTIITMTTVGYGDLSPQTPQGRIFAIFFTFIAIGVGGYAITSTAAYLIEGRAAKLAKKLRKARMKRIEELSGHYIICGADFTAVRIAEELYLANAKFIVIGSNEELMRKLLLFVHPEYSQQKIRSFYDISEVDLSQYEEMSLAEVSEMVETPYLLDNPTQDLALVRAGIGRAAGLVAAMPDTLDNLAIVVGAKALAKREGNESLRVMARADDGMLMTKMILAGADHVRNPQMISGVEMAMHMLNPEIAEWWYTINGLDKSHGTRMGEIHLKDHLDWVGMTVGELHAQNGILCMSVKQNGAFISPPPADLRLTAEDVLITMTNENRSDV